MFKILSLFCGGGGACMGYYQGAVEAGLNPMIVGVDKTYKKDYPFIFIQADVLDLIRDKPPRWWKQFDLIVASPPCQAYSRTKHLAKAQGNSVSEVLLIDEIRKLLHKIKVPYVIENVEGAGLVGVTLCGSSFDLKVRRHRVFEASWTIEQPACNHKKQGKPIGVYGVMGDTCKGVCSKTGKLVIGGSTAKNLKEAQDAMGIDWLGWSNLREAIPPAYTHFIMLDFVKKNLSLSETNPILCKSKIASESSQSELMHDDEHWWPRL